MFTAPIILMMTLTVMIGAGLGGYCANALVLYVRERRALH